MGDAGQSTVLPKQLKIGQRFLAGIHTMAYTIQQMDILTLKTVRVEMFSVAQTPKA